MKNWKKNAVVASILVFVCAGIYLNWLYTQDTETADLVDTLDQEKILGSSTLVMSQNDDLAADAAKEDLSDVSGEVTDYFAAVRLSRQESPGQRSFHAPGGHVLRRRRPVHLRLSGAGGPGGDGSVRGAD